MLCFDRGGWSADLFAEIINAGFGLLTYRKNQGSKDIPDLDDNAFAMMTWTGDDGREQSYDVADTRVTLTVASGGHKGETLDLRQVTRRDKGKQVHILTTSGKDDLPAAGVVYRMTGRWREENCFRYGRAHFALDALDSYAVTPDDPDRKVPNPAKKSALCIGARFSHCGASVGVAAGGPCDERACRAGMIVTARGSRSGSLSITAAAVTSGPGPAQAALDVTWCRVFPVRRASMPMVISEIP